MLLGEAQLAGHDTTGTIASLEKGLAIRAPLVASRPDQVVYSRGPAQLWSDLGDAHMSAAAHERTATGHRQEARRAYARSLDLWSELDRKGVLWADERQKPAELDRKLAAIPARPDAGR
jgi:hypothetical protein